MSLRGGLLLAPLEEVLARGSMFSSSVPLVIAFHNALSVNSQVLARPQYINLAGAAGGYTASKAAWVVQAAALRVGQMYRRQRVRNLNRMNKEFWAVRKDRLKTHSGKRFDPRGHAEQRW